jgi:hypothetical protein
MNILNALKAIVNTVRTYPAAYAGLLNIAVAMAAHFGFHVNSLQLVYVVTVATAVLAAVVHSLVMPTIKVRK